MRADGATVAARAPALLARWTSRPWWPQARRALTLAFFLLVFGLIAHQARSIDWSSVGSALRSYAPATLLAAVGLAAASHATYGTFDLIGRHQTGHGVAPLRVMAIGFTSYAFNLNLGTLIGGIALRFRLYTRAGVDAAAITQVFGLSLVTNWLGYLLLAGTVFAVSPLALPPDWKLGSEGLRVLGVLLLALGLAYLGMCGWARRRRWTLRGHAVELPSLRIAALQAALSILNWMLIASVVWVLLRGQVDYPSVLSVLLMAAVAGVAAHVPAGLGVLEAVFVALLGHRVAQGELLAALVAYRVIYYLFALLVAAPLFLVIDGRLGARQHRSEPAP